MSDTYGAECLKDKIIILKVNDDGVKCSTIRGKKTCCDHYLHVRDRCQGRSQTQMKMDSKTNMNNNTV